jgi:hypothetical protein
MERPYVGGWLAICAFMSTPPSQLTTKVGGDEMNHGSMPGLVLRSNA